jgi:cytochrome P450 family 110
MLVSVKRFLQKKFTMTLPNPVQKPPSIQLLEWIFTPLSQMEECSKRYGDIFTLQLGRNTAPLVVTSHPQALQEILTNDTEKFTSPGELNTEFEPLVGKQSVFTISGEAHQRQRQLLTPPFHGDRMRNYGQVINDVTEEIISQWQIGKPFYARSAMQALTLRVIIQAVFGLYNSPRAQELEKLLAVILDRGSSLLSMTLLFFPALRMNYPGSLIWEKGMRRQQKADELIYSEIQERRQKPDFSRTDILSMLIAARDEAGEQMTDEQLRDELITLLTAGHETTATALTWALYWIHKLPRVKEQLLQELDNLGENPDPMTIFKLPYLNAVCCETLRIYPVGMLTFARVAQTSVSLMGYRIEPGTDVIGSIYLAHRRQETYPEPEKFKPERFLEKQYSPYEFLPFGGGIRRCIGLAFAQFEMKLVLAKIMSRYDLALVDTYEVKPKRRGLVTGPNRPVKLVVKS